MQVLIAELSIVIVKAEFDRARAELKVDSLLTDAGVSATIPSESDSPWFRRAFVRRSPG